MKCVCWVLIFWFSSAAVAAVDNSGDPTCAKAYLTLRKGPGAQFPVTWKVARFMPFLKLETKNGWAKVQDVDGDMHWVQARDLTSNIHCVVVKTNVATLRQEPSPTAPASDLKTIDRYTPLKKLDSQGEWVHVEDESGRQAWIHETNVWKPTKIQAVTF